MRVALINPPQVFSNTQVTAGVVPPLGILYLSAYLQKNGVSVVVVDAVGEGHEQYTVGDRMTLRGLTQAEIIERIPEDVGVIGISLLYSSSYLSVRGLMAAIRFARPAATIVLGGAHSSCLPEYTLRNSEADCVVIGEGELPLLNVCRDTNALETVKGLVYKAKGEIRFNPPEELITDLDSLPFPDWPAINLERYFQAAEPHGCSYSQRWVPILAGRGCPFECTFCTTPLIWRRRWRVRSVDNVLAEMEFLHTTYGVTDFHFEDENLGTNVGWLHRFCDALIEKGLPVTWQPSNGMRAEPLLDPGLMAKMKKSGCSLVVFTLESASERVRNQIIRKHLDIASVEQAVRLANQERLKSTCYFMIGLPGETLAEARETIRYARLLARRGLDECVISLFSLLPGSELFNGFREAGKVTLDSRFFDDLLSIGDLSRFKSWTDHITSAELKRLRFHGYLGFGLTKALFYPGKVLRSLWNLVVGKDQLKSERVVRTFLKRALAGSGRTGLAGAGPPRHEG
jgi:anaerobic magnesium-protoporphyrin IX monomethyl ester cyclase